MSFERVQGAVFGAWFEASELVHMLIDQLATNRVIMAGPQSGRSRHKRATEVNSLLKVGMISRKLYVTSEWTQTRPLLCCVLMC